MTFLGAGCVAWIFLGKNIAQLTVVVLFLGLLTHHLYNMSKMVRWAQQPLGSPVPHATGIWDYLFANLSRHARIALEQREQLARSLARFREASQAMPDGVIYLSQHRTIEWMNAAAERYFGLDSESDLGRAVTTLIREPDFVHYLEVHPQNSHTTEPLVLRSQRQDNLSLSIQLVPFGEDLEMLLARDITQFERLENMRREFVANVSHELKTPLTVVNGFVETLIDAGEDITNEERQHYLDVTLDQSSRMQHLIEDLLTLSALQSGAEPACQDEVEVRALLQSILHETEVLSNSHHTITLEADDTPCILLGSQKELHSAFSNLASNAVRYTPEGGHIHLRWKIRSDGNADFSVEDDGIGIAPEHIGRLTERFYRVDRGRSRATGGTGLGLAIVKHVLSHHQAHLEIHSEPGKGSCFTAHFSSKRLQRRSV